MKNNLVLLHKSKDARSLYSGRWSTCTNPDLVFVSTSDRCFHDRRVLERFLSRGGGLEDVLGLEVVLEDSF